MSCREQDYTVDLNFDRITVRPLDPLRIREFVTRYLDDEAGEALFWRIVGVQAQLTEADFEKSFGSKLNKWREMFWTALTLPEGIEWEPNWGIVYGWQEWLTLRDAPSSLMQLARNPYMLSMLTQVYVGRGDLPPNRGELFREFVETLLIREQLAHRDGGVVKLTPEANGLLDALAELAYQMQIQRGQAEDGNALTVLSLAQVEPMLDARQRYLAASTTILEIGDDVRFTHQLLQEYFAAVRLNTLIFSNDESLKASDIWKPERWWERTNWEEAVILLAGFYSDDCSRIVEWVNRANPEVAALCVVRSGAGLADATSARLAGEWVSRLTDVQREPQPEARAAIGRALGLTMWDTRKGVSVIVRDGEKLPDIDWVAIPEGAFIYGKEDEKLTLPTFHISRYPVTYIQFQAFIDAADGFHNPRWWEGLTLPEGHEPGEQEFQFWNHPRECVSWYDAVAFCRWLSHKLGYEVRLPKEFEWEKAARGTDGREYPWGNSYREGWANVDEISKEAGKHYLEQTSAVGMYPQGQSPYGVLDMSGNVWEWCLYNYMEKSLEDAEARLLNVLHGGSWLMTTNFARILIRYGTMPDLRESSCGFRVVRP